MLDAFEKAGIPVDEYQKGPEGAGIFVIALNPKRDIVRLWLPKTGTEIKNLHFSTKHRQVCFTVFEKRRSIEKTYSYIGLSTPSENTWHLRTNFPITLPQGTNYHLKSYSTADSAVPPGSVRWNVTVEAKIPQSTQHFLVGYDESHLFISQLPKAAENVEDAHRILRPKDYKPGALRVGEFFFITESLDEDSLDKKFINRVMRTNAVSRWSDSLSHKLSLDDNGSNHKASMVVKTEGKYYAKAMVFDTTERHEPIYLDRWHRVSKNREIETFGSRNFD